MNDKIYVIWEQVGINGLDQYLMPLLDIAPEPAEQAKWNKLLVHSIGPNYWQYDKSKKIFKAEGELI